jgi:2-dehydro-3-deoxyphosphogluconate aldolase / (4S)-4-hydroxy-2-oxoglutarate aldolase
MTILAAARLIGIIRYRTEGDLPAVLDALADVGVPLLEVTLDTPGALEAIATVAGEGGTIGAGTVLDVDQVSMCADAGARFIVSPGLLEEVVVEGLRQGMEPIPGVMTPTELLRARRLGASAVKVFPAGPAGGPALIHALRSPFPEIGLVPTGGIGIDEVRAYLDAGATAVGLGNALVGDHPPRSQQELRGLRSRAAAAVAAATE